MVDIINLISQNGIAIVCVAYLIYFQQTTMKSMLNTLKTISDRLLIIEEHLGLNKKKGEKKIDEIIKGRAKKESQ